MKHTVSELTGALLDAAVAMALGWPAAPGLSDETSFAHMAFSTDWDLGGPIIERERIAVCPRVHSERTEWQASADRFLFTQHFGPTPLIAAMRAYVARKFGEEVDLP